MKSLVHPTDEVAAPNGSPFEVSRDWMMSMQMGFTDKFTPKVIEIFELHLVHSYIADIAACNVTWRPVSILARPSSYPFTAAKALFQQNAKHIATAYSQPNPIEEALCFHCWDSWP